MRKLSLIILTLFPFYFTASSQPCPADGNSMQILYQTNACFSEYLEECTIGVALGIATPDGRPLVWKTRDNGSAPNNEVKYITLYTYNYVCVTNAGSSVTPWMGVNEHGLAILNSMIYDLSSSGSGPGNGAVMRYALGSCITVDDFQTYLDSTNITGRTTTANFAVIDATGEAAIFETSGDEYFKFDARDSPNGYIVRTNFTITGGGNSGLERYIRTSNLIEDFYNGDSLNHKSILRHQMRDFSDLQSQPVAVPFPGQWIPSLPYGYIVTNLSICRTTSVSTAVIQGVLEDEDPGLSTLWAKLGHPATAITVPYWPVGNTPIHANGTVTAPLCNLAKNIRELLYDYPDCEDCINSYKLLDGEGEGLWMCSFPSEDIILDSAETLLNEWRNVDTIPVTEMLDSESALAEMAFNSLELCLATMVGRKTITAIDQFRIYPNPVDNILKISSKQGLRIDEIIIYNQIGQTVQHKKVVDQILDVSSLSPGLYVLEVSTGNKKWRGKFIK